MRKQISVFIAIMAMAASVGVASAQTTCDSITLPYFEDFNSATGTLPDCWTYDGSYIGWNNWPATSGNGELFFRAYSAGQPAVLPSFYASSLSKLEITFKTKCGTIAEGDAILIGVADDAGNLLQWIDTITDPNHSRNAWVWHTYNFLAYTGAGTRIALGRLWNTSGDNWVAIDDISVRQLPNCYPAEDLQADGLIDPDGISFSWTSFSDPDYWQVYIDTVGIDINEVDSSLFIEVSEPYYAIPEGTVQGGGKYMFYVRGVCVDIAQSDWLTYEFGAGTVVMNNTGVADHVTGCGFVVYDNGGPIAGYLAGSNSVLTIHADGVGNQLRVEGGAFGFGSTGASLNIYDGTTATGTPLYTYNTTDGRDTIGTTLATSTLGALTITFTSSGNMAHTGYELYVRCTAEPSCARPTGLEATMVSADDAQLDWNGTASAYQVRYRQADATTWTDMTVTTNSATLTGLVHDATYEANVRSICGTADTSIASVTVSFVADINCQMPTDLTFNAITDTSVTLAWSSDGERWEVELDGQSHITTSNPMRIGQLHPGTYYSARVRTLCDAGNSAWTPYGTFATTNTTGIGTVDDPSARLDLRPNPATDGTVSIVLDEASTITISDLAGRTVRRYQCAAGSTRISLAGLAAGTYMVQAIGTTATRIAKLVVESNR